jgi:hypothetical protein
VAAGVFRGEDVLAGVVIETADGVAGKGCQAVVVGVHDSQGDGSAVEGSTTVGRQVGAAVRAYRRFQLQDGGIAVPVTLGHPGLDVPVQAVDEANVDRIILGPRIEGVLDAQDVARAEQQAGAEESLFVSLPPETDDEGCGSHGLTSPSSTWR